MKPEGLKPNKDDNYSRVKNRKAYADAMTRIGVGAQHNDGLSSQHGRTTIIYRNGEKIFVRSNGVVIRPDEVRALRRMKMSMFELLEATNSISYVGRPRDDD